MMMPDEKLLLNGRIVPAAEASISPLDRGFLYGEGFFETTRVFKGRPFLLSAHLQRLRESCEWAGWEQIPGRDAMKSGIRRLIDANQVRDGYLRISLAAGVSGEAQPTLLAQAHEMELAPPGEAAPVTLAPADAARAEGNPLVQHKSLSYHDNVLARQLARSKDADEVYFLNHAGHLAEGAISNLFFVADGTVHTPDLSCGLLPGIARRTVLQLCRRHEIPFRTDTYREDALHDGDEAFCTNSLRGIMPVSGIVKGPAFAPVPGPLTATLQDFYGEHLRAECAGD